VKESRREIRTGIRYYFRPETCMLPWQYSGLVHFLNRTPAGPPIRIEGLWIG
jgi:hypothetical protein